MQEDMKLLTLGEFQRLALRTEREDMSPPDRLVHAHMGLLTEWAEVIDAVKHSVSCDVPFDNDEIVAEVGDVLWYLASIASTQKTTLPGRVATNENLKKLLKSAMRVAGLTVRHKNGDINRMYTAMLRVARTALRHANDVASEDRLDEEFLGQQLCYAVICLVLVESTLEVAATRNIAKLRVRFPHKFTAQASNNRDTGAEKAAMCAAAATPPADDNVVRSERVAPPLPEEASETEIRCSAALVTAKAAPRRALDLINPEVVARRKAQTQGRSSGPVAGYSYPPITQAKPRYRVSYQTLNGRRFAVYRNVATGHVEDMLPMPDEVPVSSVPGGTEVDEIPTIAPAAPPPAEPVLETDVLTRLTAEANKHLADATAASNP